MNGTVQKIKERLSIVDVISSYLTLEKAGKNYKARCPFHNEKTPSFFISPERGSYYCFGCNAKGDIFSFVEHFEGVDFMGALKLLADRAGVPLSIEKDKNKDETSILYEIMEEATLFYESILFSSKEPLIYLKERGAKEESLKEFRVGYAPESWNSLENYLTKKGFKKEDIEKVGLIKKSTNGNLYYDRFRGRIMFPICDSAGRVIAFSGRFFKKIDASSKIEEAKYINSPDTPLYNKANVLFGLDKAKNSIKKMDYSIVVEGQMDLIMSHQIGFTNTVAVSGTAFTDTTEDSESKINNLGLIRRLSNNTIFAYDGDDAGIRAANRSAMIALSLDMQVKIAFSPKGKDPADTILGNPNEWKDIIKKSMDIIDFVIREICESTDNKETRRKKIEEKIFPFLILISSSIKKSNYIKEIYNKTGIREEALVEDFKNYERKKETSLGSKDTSKSQSDDLISRKDRLSKRLFAIISWGGETEEEKVFINEMKNYLEEGVGPDNYKKTLELYEPFSENLVFEGEKWYGGKFDLLKRDTRELVLNLEEEILNEQSYLLLLKIKEEESRGNKEKVKEDIINYQKIVEKIEEIKNRRIK